MDIALFVWSLTPARIAVESTRATLQRNAGHVEVRVAGSAGKDLPGL